jgi:CRP-like cAMP-binding protein
VLDSYKKVLKGFSPEFYSRGDFVYKVNDIVGKVFIIKSGNVKVFHPSEENSSEIIFRFCSSGEIIGLKDVMYSDRYSDSCSAVCDSFIYSIPSELFKGIVEQDFELKFKLMQILCGKIQTLENNIFSLRESRSDQRFAEAVDILAETFGLSSDGSLNVKLNPEDLAAVTCLSVSYLRKLISRFCEAGIVCYSNGTLRILDRKKLLEVYRSTDELHHGN